MALPIRTSSVNRLLAGLSPPMHATFLEKCELVELRYGEILGEPGERIDQVYFPTEGFISQVATIEGNGSLEVGLIGNEGMLGIPLALGVGISPLRAIVQGSGVAWRMEAEDFVAELEEIPVLPQLLRRYAYVLMVQLAQTAICTCFHPLEARLARWLLMTRDRAHADHFYLTHELLATMLGVRRSGVSNAAAAMQRRSLILYSRGSITILDRDGLEEASCECYRVVANSYATIFESTAFESPASQSTLGNPELN